jgi:hypothetical protein
VEPNNLSVVLLFLGDVLHLADFLSSVMTAAADKDNTEKRTLRMKKRL